MILSRNASVLLQRVMMKTGERAKLLILLGSIDCPETGQRDWNQDRTSISGRASTVAHKVFHRCGGEDQKQPKIKNLQPEAEFRLKSLDDRSLARRDDA
ncbi:MAG TPA: hypothetical protein VH041_08905 [Caldimonas sp.]|nr:hypothetical protein [Caldimonas sp.]